MLFPRFSALSRHSDLLKLWVGQTVSQLGSQVSLLAVPLTAVVTLGASATQVGILRAADTVPVLLVGLFAGAWVDRMRRRSILIAADVCRALLLASIPLAAVLHTMSIELLYVVGFLVGTLTVFFDVAYASFLPSLVPREKLVEANSKLEATNSAARVAGPSLGGLLVGWLTAPIAVAIDAASFGLSALLLGWIRMSEQVQGHSEDGQGMMRDIVEGLGVVVRNPTLRAVTATTSAWAISDSITFTVLVLFVIRELGVRPVWLGLIYAGVWVGFVPGTLLVSPANRRHGPGRTMVGGAVLSSFGGALTPVAGGPTWLAVSILFLAMFLLGLGAGLFSINEISLKQSITPDRLLGRVNATTRVLALGATPLGALLGGALGDWIGLRPTLAVGAAGSFLGFLWVWFSPVRALSAHLSNVDEFSRPPE